MLHGPNSRRKPQPMTSDGLMTAAQAATLKRLTQDAYELDAFKPNLTRTEADIRVAMLTAKLKLLDEPPHPVCTENLNPDIMVMESAKDRV